MSILLAYLWFLCASLRASSPAPARRAARPIARQWTLSALFGRRLVAIRLQVVAV
jgi:hypothetical protein